MGKEKKREKICMSVETSPQGVVNEKGSLLLYIIVKKSN